MSKSKKSSSSTRGNTPSTPTAVILGRKSVEIMVKKKQQKKQDWNLYLTEENRFRATPEELFKKKQLLISKHNILTDQYQPSKLKTNVKILKSKIHQIAAGESSASSSFSPSLSLSVKKRDNNNQNHNQNNKENATNLSQQSFPSDSRRKKMEEEKSTSLDLLELESAEETEEDEISSDYENHAHHHRQQQQQQRHRREHRGSERNADQSALTHGNLVVKNLPFKSFKRITNKKRFYVGSEKIPDSDLINISKELQLLFQELRYYEELSGKRSILQSQELQELLPEDELNENLDQKKVIRVLVNLVCQTMTYLLKSEVDQYELKNDIDSLKAKYQELQDSVFSRSTVQVYTSQPGLFMPPHSVNETQGKRLITTPAVSPLVPSSQQVPADLSQSARIGDLLGDAYPSTAGEGSNLNTPIRTIIDGQFQSMQPPRGSITPVGGASTASNSSPVVTTPSAATAAFTGSSPTDLLFSPANLASFQKKSITPPAPIKVQTSNPKPKTPSFDITATPLPSYQSNDVSNFSTRTQDLLISEYDDQRRVISEDGDSFFDYNELLQMKGQYLMNARDSTESTIERLSQQYASALSTSKSNHSPATTPSHQHSRLKEEQPSIGGPNQDIPIPVQASQHPFKLTVGKDGKSQPIMKQSAPFIPFPKEKRIYDATNGSY